jgi:hypothetical protein
MCLWARGAEEKIPCSDCGQEERNRLSRFSGAVVSAVLKPTVRFVGGRFGSPVGCITARCFARCFPSQAKVFPQLYGHTTLDRCCETETGGVACSHVLWGVSTHEEHDTLFNELVLVHS